MSRWKRPFSMLLALLMIFTSVPLPVFAAEEPVCAAHTEHDAACGYADAVAGTPCTHVCGENCPTDAVTLCVHDHAALGCTYTEPKEAVYCGHACNTGTCGYKPEVPGVDCTCSPSLTHADTCASLGEGECDCSPTWTHEATCAPVAAQAEVPCDFSHDGCGCSEAVTGGWSCNHVCSVESGCITQVCIHTCPNDGCGYTAPKAAAPCTHTCAVCELQKLIDALPAEVTAENLDAVGAQLTAIDQAKAKLSDEQLELVDFTRYQNAIASINVLNGQAGAEQPQTLASGTCGSNATWSISGTTLTISGTGDMANYFYDESSPTQIAQPWASYASQITKVVVSEGITNVGNNAFNGFSKLTTVSLPSTITALNPYCFEKCTSLTSFTIPSTVKSIGFGMFQGCTSLVTVSIPSGITEIPDYLFWNCSKLKNVTLPSNVTYIGQRAFSNCTALTTLTLPNTVKTLGTRAFQESGLTSINIPTSLTVIKESTFWLCESLKTVTIPVSVKEIQKQAFAGCYALTDVYYAGSEVGWNNITTNPDYFLFEDYTTIHFAQEAITGKCGDNLSWSFDEATGTLTVTGSGPMAELGSESNFPWYSFRDDIKSVVIGENITTVARNAFAADEDETQLSSVKLPSTLVSIGEYAFSECYYLNTISIPDSVTTIGNYAFEYLDSISIGKGLKNLGEFSLSYSKGLGSITVSSANPNFTAKYNVLYNKNMTELVAYPRGLSTSTFTVPATVTSIRGGAFCNPSYLSKITFTGNAPALSANSFQGVTAEIQYDSTKSGWSSVVPNQYGGQITWVSNGILTGKTGEDLTWTLNTATGAFSVTGTGRMEYYNFSESEYTPWHNYRSQIKSVTVGEGITSVGGYNFSGCSNLASVTLPSTLKDIGTRAFSGCSSLKSIVLPKNLSTIGESAFNGAGLTSVTIPDSVTEIKHYAFQQCAALTEVTFGKGLHTIGGNVFFSCKALRKATFTGGAPWPPDNDIFSQCTNVTAIYPAGNTSWTEAKRSDISTNATWKTDCDHTGETSYVDNADGLTHSKTCANCGTVLAEGENHSFTSGKCTCGAYKCGDNAFATISDSGVLTVYGTGAMYDYTEAPWYPRTGITSVEIQSGITYIGNYAFANCTNLTGVKIADTVTELGSSVFANCTKLDTATIPSSVTKLGSSVFNGCSGLTSVTLPSAVTAFGQSMFRDCTSLTNVTLPEGLEGVPEYTFYGCTKLTSVIIPEGVKFLQLASFYGTGVTSITLPESLEYIYESAFENAAGLKSVTVPETVGYIGSRAFSGTGLTKVTFQGTPSVIGTSAFGSVTADVYYFDDGSWTSSNKLQYGGTLNWIAVDPCADGHSYTYTNLYNGKHTKVCEDCDLTAVTEDHTYVSGVCVCGQAISGKCGDNATWSYNTATGVLNISGTGAMYDYYYDEDDSEWISGKTPGWYGLELSKVDIGSGITVVGGYAFYRMDLDTVILADTVTEVRYEAFGGCTANITNSKNLTTVGIGAMVNNTIDKLYKPVTVADEAFMWATFIDGNVVVSGELKKYAFFGSNITTLTLTKNVKYVRDYSLSGCDSLTAIYFCCDKPDFGNNVYDGGGVTGNTITYYRSSKATGFSASTAIWDDADHATIKGTPVAPTCTEAGYTPYTCPYCFIVVKADEVDAKGHSYTYTPDETADTITVGCSSCDLEVVFTLNAPASLDYTGNPLEATVSGEGENMTPTVTYTGPTTEGKPVNGGEYTATMTLGGKSVSVSFTVVGSAVACVTVGDTTTEYLSLAEAVTAANAAKGATLKLLSDISTVNTVAITGDVILDLNGHKLSNGDRAAIDIASGAKLTVNDSVSGGSIYGEAPIGSSGGAIINRGTLVLNAGTLSAGGSSTPCAVLNSGSFTMNGGELKGKNSLAASTGSVTFNGGKVSAQMAVTGGTMVFNDGDFTALNSVNGYIRGADVTIYGGTFGSINFNSPGATVNVYGGTFKAQFVKGSADVTLYGGTFNGGVKSSGENITNMLADGYSFFDADGNTLSGQTYGTTEPLTVRPSDNLYVVSHKLDSVTTNYYSLEASIAQAERFGGTLTLMKNITVTAPVKINSGDFDFSSGRYTLSGSLSGGVIEVSGATVEFVANTGGLIQNTGTGSAISVTNGYVVLYSGNIQASGNAVTAKNSTVSVHPYVEVISTGAAAIYADGGEKSVILSGGKLQGVTAAVEAESGAVIFSKAVNDLSASSGPMILLHSNARIAVQVKMNASTGYTVKLATETGIGSFGSSLDSFHVDGCFAAYENGLYVEYTNKSLYLRKETKPNGSIDFYNEKIVGLKPNTAYRVSGHDYDIFTDDTGALTIYEEWMGTEITITEQYVSGARPQSLAIPERPAYPTGISIRDESTVGKNDGALTGLNNGLEYRMDTGDDSAPWIRVTGTSLENLTSGSYSVRVAATDSSFAGHIADYGIGRGTYSAEHFDVTVPADSVYDGTVRKAAVKYPDELEAQNVKVFYHNESGVVEAPADAGTYNFTIQVSDPIHGEYTLTDTAWTFTIAKRNVEILNVEISDQTFTGQDLSPDAKVTFGNLPSGCSVELLRDYTLTYSNSVDAGTATVSVEPVDTSNYTFQKKEFSFTIQPCPVRVDFFLLETTKIYSGLEKRPTPSICWYDVPDGLNLVQGTDYTITFANNINVGTATVTLAPVAGSNFTFETKVVEFTIVPAFVTANVTEIADQDYTGKPIEPKVTVKFSGAFLNEKPVLDKDYTVTYLDNINAGTATVVIAPVDGGNINFKTKELQFNILPCKTMVVVKDIAPQTYTGKPIVPEVQLVFTNKSGEVLTLVENVDYTMTITDNINVGSALICVNGVEGSNYDVTFTRGDFQIDPCELTAAVTSPGRLAYTGLELCPDIALTFTGVPEGCVPEVGKDYIVEYRDNIAVTDSATATVKRVEGSNFTFAQTETTFSICYCVQLPELRDQVYVDGVPYAVEPDGFLWLDHENHKMVTWYDFANNGDSDIHKIYPTGMYVAELTFSEVGGYMAKRVTELDNTLQYSGTSIRITGNQGIRFITSVPTGKKSALTGSGLAGYTLVEYGTLMGWYAPGTELIYGANATSVAYNKASGTDQVFNTTGDLVQFTGMLTNLDLEQSTRDLMTRPYMVLERTNAEGQTEQVVLYGGSITRSIGYVALQNKDVFTAGTASYEFIWNILSYAYPDLYEAEYKG